MRTLIVVFVACGKADPDPPEPTGSPPDPAPTSATGAPEDTGEPPASPTGSTGETGTSGPTGTTGDTGPASPTGDTAPPPPLGSCGDALPLHDHGTDPRFEDTFATLPQDHETPSCGPGVPGSELVFDFDPPADGTWWFHTTADGVDTRISVRSDCTDPATELACRDEAGDDQQSEVFVALTAGTPVSVLVERRIGLDPVNVDVRAERVAALPLAPTVSSATALCGDDDRLLVDAVLTEGERPVSTIAVRALDDQGAELCLVDVLPDAWPAALDCSGAVASVTVQARDTLDQTSSLESAPCASPPTRTLGEACDPDAYADRCTEGTCTGEPARCTNAQAPTLGAAAAFVRPDVARLAVVVSGDDVDADVVEIEVQLLDAVLDPVVVTDETGSAPYPVLTLPFTPGTASFTAEIKAGLPPSAPISSTYALAVTLRDAAGFVSAPATAIVEAPHALSAGAACDPFETRDACPANTACRPVDPLDVLGDHECGDPDPACPASATPGVPTVDQGDPDRFEAQATPTSLLVPPPACATTQPQALFQFTAPSAGLYRFGVTGPVGAPLWAGLRTACGIESVDTALACLTSDLATGTPLNLATGATVTVVVGGTPPEGEPSLGPVTLTVTRESP